MTFLSKHTPLRLTKPYRTCCINTTMPQTKSLRTARNFESSCLPSLFPNCFNRPASARSTYSTAFRVVMAPMTRLRANAQHVHGSLALEYYRQRTTIPGTLAISEGTIIAAQAGGWKKTPGIWSDEQISGWSPVRRHLLSRRSRRVMPLFLPTYLSTPFYLRGRS